MVFPVMAAMALGSAAASVYGGRQANKANKAMAAQQEAIQREFAQQGIRWKVADAKAAGLHPLYAIGAQGAQYSPVSYSDSMGPAIAQAGQQLSSAAGQYIDYKNQQRIASEQRQLAQDQIILGQQRLRSQIHVDTAQANYYNAMAAQALRQPSSGFPASSDLPETAQTGDYKIVPAEITSASKNDASLQAGPAGPAWMDVRVGDISWLPKGLQVLRVPKSDESWAEEFVEKLPAIAAVNAARYYKWLSSDSLAAMYMSPYGRIRLINMARQKAPEVYHKLLKALQGRKPEPTIRRYRDNNRGGFQGTGEF